MDGLWHRVVEAGVLRSGLCGAVVSAEPNKAREGIWMCDTPAV